jgi:hypothetical protein
MRGRHLPMSSTPAQSTSTPASSPVPHTKRLWVKRGVAALVMVLLLVGLTLWVITRGWFIISRVSPELASKLGGDVTIGSAAYKGGSRFDFENVVLRSKSIAGDGGEIVRLGRASVHVNLPQLLLGRVLLTDVKVDDAVVRMSEDAHHSGEFNFMTLEPEFDPQTDRPDVPPTVTIKNAVVEYGVHEDGRFQVEGARRVSGLVKPAEDAPGWFYFELGEIGDKSQDSQVTGVSVRGLWNFATNEHWSTTTGLQLDSQTFLMCPQVVRAAWDAMDLVGSVSSMREQWAPDQPFSVTLTVDDVGLTLPVDAREFWARYRDGDVEPTTSQPRMHVKSGLIKLTNQSIVLDKLVGNLAGTQNEPGSTGVPYVISVTVEPLPPIDWNNKEQWAEQALRTAPFDVRFQIDDFTVQRDERGEMPALDLPIVVAKSLAKFQLTDWSLKSTVQVTRSEPIVDDSGQLVGAQPITHGQAYITNASGRYAKFPYTLENIQAHLTFDNEQIVIDYVKGSGSGGAPVQLMGRIAPPDSDAAVSLRLVGTNVPVDERLRSALGEEEREMYDAVFCQAAHESLSHAGLLPDEAFIKGLEERRLALSAELTVLKQTQAGGQTVDEARIENLTNQMTALQRQILAGPFAMGGTVNLNLQIEREYGDIKPTITTGEITFNSIGIIYEQFPYPVRIVDGTVDWKEHDIRIRADADHPGLRVETAGGGEGLISGGLERKDIDGRRRWLPRLSVLVARDEINDLLYAAIPRVAGEPNAADEHSGSWPGGALSEAARLLRGVGLSGQLQYAGIIGADDHGDVTYDLDVTLANAEARPTVELAGAIGAAGLLWPENYTLRDVSAQLKVRHDGVVLERFNGRHRHGAVTASGTVNLTGASAESAIDVQYKNFELGPYVVNFAPARRVEDARKLWELYQPQGVIDANLTFRVTQGRAEAAHVQVFPADLSILVDGRRVYLQHRDGDLALQGGQIEFRNLAVDMFADNRISDGRLVISGGYDFAAEGQPLRLHGEWMDGVLESPLIVEAMRLFGAPDAVDEFKRYKPAGQFDAAFDIDYAGGDSPPTYAITSRPKSLSMVVRGTPVSAEIQSGQVTFRPGRIEIDKLLGRHAGGLFGVDGLARTTGSIDAVLHMTYDGRLISNQVLAFLPGEARQAVTAIEFDDGGPSRIDDCTLHLQEMLRADGPSVWRSDFRGVVHTSGASFIAGVRFSEVDGAFDIHAQHDPGQPVRLSMSANASHMKALGQDLTAAEWSLSLSDAADEVQVPSFRALAGNWEASGGEGGAMGSIAGAAQFGIGQRRDYKVTVDLAGVPLSGFSGTREVESMALETPGGAEPPPNRREPTGEVFASVSLQGLRDGVNSRTGRGVIRIIRGRMASVPLLLQLVQITQLTAPVRGTLDFADVSWFLDGDRVVFERIVFESTMFNNAMLQLIGEGEMQFSTTELNTRFRSRSGIALLRDIVGGLGDAFYEIEVTGTLREPKARLVMPAKDSP